MTTLVPLHKLLDDIATRLNTRVRPHVSGDVFVEVADAVEVLQALAKLGVDDVHTPVVPPLEDELPDYCDRHDCQNLAAVGWGAENVRLCFSCYDEELTRVGDTVTALRRLS